MDSLKLVTNVKNAGTLLQKAENRESWKTLLKNDYYCEGSVPT